MNALLAAGTFTKIADGFPLLTFVLFAPVVGAALVACVPKSNIQAVRGVALLSSFVTFLLSVLVLLGFRKGAADFQFVTQHHWLSEFGIQYKLGVDGISLFLVVLTGLIFPIAFIATSPSKGAKSFAVWMLLLEAGCLGSLGFCKASLCSA
jgi:NADH-quinone oxidoreductase subunit M